ncbi:efflux RND transporter periplasmic adaptor subunit [Thermodesulfobacteriota bacterium]
MLDIARASEGKYLVRFVLVLGFLWLISACDSKRNEYVEPPPPKVTVAQPVQQEVIDYLEFTGTSQAFEEADIQARVAGFLQSMYFSPGAQVKKGDLLFVIDPKEYQAELNAATAELKAAGAMQHRAEIEYERAKRVFDQGAGRETDVVKWRGERDVTLASIERAKAKVERARLDLSYTQIIAPISGRVGRNLVDMGNLVGESEPTLLTKVTRFDPMYVYFNLNERDLLRVMDTYRQTLKEKGGNPEEEPDSRAGIPLFLGRANEDGYPHEGKYDFAESSVDPGTGTMRLRGVFENPGLSPLLVPGLFVRLRLPIDKKANALLVTERAIGADQGGNFLMTVGNDNMVSKKPIRMGRLVDGLRVIDEGLQPGERVIVKGLQRARPGAKVDPEQIEMKTLTASAIKAAAEAKIDQSQSAAAAAPEKVDSKSAEKEEKKE